MASQDPWNDFDNLRHNIKQNTVDRLKQIITGLNDDCSTLISKSGKKQELIDRIVRQLDSWKQSNNTALWMKAKAILHQVRTSGVYSPAKLTPDGTAYHPHSMTHSQYGAGSSTKLNGYHQSPGATSSGLPRYDPYAPPRRPLPSSVATSSAATPAKSTIRFKHSPFFRIDEPVSSVVECPESAGSMDRRQGNLSFSLTLDQIRKLQSTNPKYQLRLFCTSSSFYSPGLTAYRANTGPCPIEFPPTCEVRVNNVQLTANLKGLKKKPGTAPPADLGKAVRITPQMSNRVEMVYVNSQQGVPPKKYYLVVMLVETTTVEQLVDRLQKGKYKSREDVLAQMKQTASEDDDIVAGAQKMSLKCPLSYMRIRTPTRSAACVHHQCFDATSWFSMMEQTTTWLCPVCERVLNVEELIVDGYFDDILKRTSEDVEDVIVEADGEWHTSDNKYASPGWKATHPEQAMTVPDTPRKPVRRDTMARTPTKTSADMTNGASGEKGKAKADNVEILVLDSDDEDDDRVKRELSPSADGRSSTNGLVQTQSYASIPPRSQSLSMSQTVIDLTLDSDEEAPPPPRRPGKRKTSEPDGVSPTEPVWKKSRPDPGYRANGTNGHVNASTACFPT
ncbi:hypothetical protein GLOTRDRAFT_68408 [Gloeophyllum trabeum ATCC 11539]|uniref:Zf-MIZ-domain-containing protein n=1 Tax=Gloeophyllum trabeum (strain ATCC 11539 / FP-39264 / Madison 617) TaxID=670483 RepID=S7QMI9_GLOTA|nr:uncharacterized protein GLOTRDRAFT_68408 [Gloeophyllum trabeum ATCC 11539]EPQ60617.1 hypothetical protein GLOTRDRAFT_68408 [Gloeophyllum trabeum ATCC 11539]